MMRSRTLALLLAACLLGAAPSALGLPAPEEADHSENVRQIGRVEMRLTDGTPWDTGYMAFEDDILVGGAGFDQYTETAEETTLARGFGIFRILPRAPYLKQLSFFRCSSGQQGDISIWKGFVFLSVSGANEYTSKTCNNTDDSAGKTGVRVVDISDPRHPRQVRFIDTSCGSTIHTLVPGKNGVAYIYEPNGGACPTGSASPSFRMDVIRFDPNRPRKADVVTAPNLQGQDGCMDIAVFMPRRLAACMMLYHVSLYDISDPLNPKFLKEITPPGAANMNEAGFTWDGNVLILSDQGEGAGLTAACSGDASTPDFFFYAIEDINDPTLLGTYSAERTVVPDTDRRFIGCMPWDFTIVPTKDPTRYKAAVGYMAGGMSLIDFSVPSAATEIAYYVAMDGETSASDVAHNYWYRGRFYVGEGQTRKGIRVMKIDGFSRANVRDMSRYNPQTQVGPVQ